MTAVTNEQLREYAVEQLELALRGLNPDPDYQEGDETVIAAELALMAIKMWLDEPDPVRLNPPDVLELVAEPVCICPPDLVLRGGFKSGCPVHA